MIISTLRRSPLVSMLLCLMALGAMGCGEQSTGLSNPRLPFRSGPSAEETAALKLALEATAPVVAGQGKSLQDQTRQFYALRHNKPAWIARGKPLPAVKGLTMLLGSAADEGLDPHEYGVAEIPGRLGALVGAKDATAAMQLELGLTAALLRYGSHVALGHPIADQIDPYWTIAPRTVDVPGIVNQAVMANKIDQLPIALAPANPEYARLREMLQRYRKLAAERTFQAIPADLKPITGQPNPHLAALRNNLLILGDLQEQAANDDNVFNEDLSEAQTDFEQRNAAQPEQVPNAKRKAVVDVYDENLGEAVRRFEARHGLNPDGVPDPAMIAAMNVPLADRARQLALNLERWRWLPADFGTPHIVVNIASYRMQVRDVTDTVSLKMRVIAGKPSNRTPVFSDMMTVVVFSPYWNIPQSIETKEMLPALARDPDYLRKQRIEVVDDGEGNIQLRQKPGARNALGFVKFLFPNRHNVYLHDTPTDNLFDRLTRDLSHGCIRLEHPVELATYLLRDQPEWTAEKIQAAMHAGKEKHVALKNPLPVHIVYLTARVDEDGVPQFFEDVYGYDVKQRALLYPSQTAAN